jgi:SAM-dependent methyltransferase
MSKPIDQDTADAFAASWNHLPAGSVYTRDQFVDWMAPLTQEEVQGKKVLELGCGSGCLMYHMISWKPSLLVGVDLGDAVVSARRDLALVSNVGWRVEQGDLTQYSSDGFDITYCIGVLQHLKDPKAGLDAVIRNTVPGGAFHAWVYAREGNGLIVSIVDPIRKIASRLPWWLTKYGLATPLVAPYYVYAKLLAALPKLTFLKSMPLYDYSMWIARREFAFFRHVAFDQLVTPQTVYFPRATIEGWLKSYPEVDQKTTYIIMRNGNSWKFGGRKKK